jgi:formamidopyrimidine-DNA glycosylase
MQRRQRARKPGVSDVDGLGHDPGVRNGLLDLSRDIAATAPPQQQRGVAVDLVREGERECGNVRQIAKELTNYFVALLPAVPCVLALAALFWPWVVQAPGNLDTAVRLFSHFPWHGKVLFDGQLFAAAHLPAIYLPKLLALQLPELVLFGLLAAAGFGIRAAYTGGWRSLTDPRLFSGIGNAYSDEILHRARLSPIAQTRKLTPGDVLRLYASARSILSEWTARLRDEAGSEFPAKVTAFRPQMAVHGRFGQPCPDCGAPVQRIVYAENETNYCPRCQTGGTILADRALSRLLKSSWPRSIDELG